MLFTTIITTIIVMIIIIAVVSIYIVVTYTQWPSDRIHAPPVRAQEEHVRAQEEQALPSPTGGPGLLGLRKGYTLPLETRPFNSEYVGVVQEGIRPMQFPMPLRLPW